VHLIDDSAGAVTTGGFVNLLVIGTGDPTPYSFGTVAVGQTVIAVNDPPVANNDVASTGPSAAVDIDVLANDTDVEGATLSIFGTPTALHGTVTINDDGTLRYTPNVGHLGVDTITYQVTDGLLTDQGQVTVTTEIGVTILGTGSDDVIGPIGTPLAQPPFATGGPDFILGVGGNDTIRGGGGADHIDGGNGNDTLFGDAGNDNLTGNAGIDSVFGGSGNDVLNISGLNDVNDILDGGDGIDTVAVLGNIPVTLAGFNALQSSIEIWQGNNRAVLGTNTSNVFDFSALQGTGTGIPSIDGAGGNDIIIGSKFNDVILGGSGNDHLTGGLGNDTLTGGADADVFSFTDLLAGNANFGKDKILLFEVNADVLEFDSAIFADAQTALAHATDDGLGNTVITVDANNTITLQGIAATNLQLSNFSIV